MRILSLLAILAAACGGDTVQTVNQGGQGGPVADDDEDPPEIEHTPVTTSQTYGERVDLEATIVDEVGQVFRAEIYYKTETSNDYLTTVMNPGPGENLFVGSIPSGDVTGGGMHYFIVAFDDSQNEGFSPEDGEADPYHFRVTE